MMNGFNTPQRPREWDPEIFFSQKGGPQARVRRDMQNINVEPAPEDPPNIVQLQIGSSIDPNYQLKAAFKHILSVEEDYYIDRSIFIYYFYTQCAVHFGFDLPSQWGKDVTLDTIYSFFDHIDAYTDEENQMRTLVFFGSPQFKLETGVRHSGLNITRVPTMRPYYGKHCVVRIDWEYFNVFSVDAFFISVGDVLRQHFYKYRKIITQEPPNQAHIELLKRYLSQELLTYEQIYSGFKILSYLLQFYSQYPVIILTTGLDEFLTQLEMTESLENLRLIKIAIIYIFTFTLEKNPSVYKSLIVTSDRTKLNDFIKKLKIEWISCLKPQYLHHILPRTSDVELLLTKAGIPQNHWKGLMMRFDGYYSNTESLYPPCPVLSVLQNHKNNMKDYQMRYSKYPNIREPNFGELVRESHYAISVPLVSKLMKSVPWVRTEVAALSKGGFVLIKDTQALTIPENIELNNWARNPYNDDFLDRGAAQWFYKLLLCTGLLTFYPDARLKKEKDVYCHVPNKSVREKMLADLQFLCSPFKTEIGLFMAMVTPVCAKLEEIVLAAAGRRNELPMKIKEFGGLLRELFIGCHLRDSRMPHNTEERMSEICENALQGILFACLVCTPCARNFRSEYRGGRGPQGRPGRVDLFFESKQPPVAVFIELKCNSETAEQALQQIIDRQYDEKYATKAHRVRMGVAVQWGQTQEVYTAHQLLALGQVEPAG